MKYALILEDDFQIIDDNFNDLFKKSVNFVEKNYNNIDILYLGGVDVSKNKNYNYGINKTQFLFCLHSYIITQKGVDKLLNSLPMKEAVDLFVHMNLESYRIYTFIIKQRYTWNVKSNIVHTAHTAHF